MGWLLGRLCKGSGSCFREHSLYFVSAISISKVFTAIKRYLNSWYHSCRLHLHLYDKLQSNPIQSLCLGHSPGWCWSSSPVHSFTIVSPSLPVNSWCYWVLAVTILQRSLWRLQTLKMKKKKKQHQKRKTKHTSLYFYICKWGILLGMCQTFSCHAICMQNLL